MAVIGLLTLQFYWIKNYYEVNKTGFEKEVNLAFEDAIKKEFSLRCDTIQALIVERLMDTTEFTITSQLKKDGSKYDFIITNKHDPKDLHSFSFLKLSGPIIKEDTILKRKVAEGYAKMLRDEDLESHVVWYRTQNLGSYMNEKVNNYDFDTARLRPVLQTYLKQRNITVPFQFFVRKDDSTMNRNVFPKELAAKFPVITKSHPTYKLRDDSHFVRAMFSDPFSYIISRMGFIFISSVVLIVIITIIIFILLRLLFREKKLSAIKNDFISNITHEFKTPVATVSAAVEALSDFNVLKDEEKTNRYLSHSKKELDRLSGLIDKLLNISFYENRQLKLNPEPVNINDTVQAIMQSHLLATSKKVNFSYSNESGIHFIRADKIHFHHSVNNVIDNGIKYSGDIVNINIKCTQQKDFLVIAVTDNGNGIAEKDIKFVFDKFYRVSNTGQHLVKGHGLGLNYVKNIVESHHGWCILKSNPGKGSVISLAWPV
jgi:signal transduction histidine kinase